MKSALCQCTCVLFSRISQNFFAPEVWAAVTWIYVEVSSKSRKNWRRERQYTVVVTCGRNVSRTVCHGKYHVRYDSHVHVQISRKHVQTVARTWNFFQRYLSC